MSMAAAKPELAKWCADPQHRTARLRLEAAIRGGRPRATTHSICLRPDTYVALADASGAPEAVDRYCAERGTPDRGRRHD